MIRISGNRVNVGCQLHGKGEKAMPIRDREGKPIRLQEGDRVYFDKNNKVLWLVSSEDFRLRWNNGDDKKYVDFINQHMDFFMLAEIVAETNGLQIQRLVSNIPGRLCYEFVNP